MVEAEKRYIRRQFLSKKAWSYWPRCRWQRSAMALHVQGRMEREGVMSQPEERKAVVSDQLWVECFRRSGRGGGRKLPWRLEKQEDPVFLFFGRKLLKMVRDRQQVHSLHFLEVIRTIIDLTSGLLVIVGNTLWGLEEN